MVVDCFRSAVSNLFGPRDPFREYNFSTAGVCGETGGQEVEFRW